MILRIKFLVPILMVCFLILPSQTSAASEDVIYLETIGGFGGSYIYMTYAYIGVTADAYSKKIYQPQQVKVMMNETVSMIDKLNSMLIKVQKTDVVENDRKFVKSMIEILNLLQVEARSLSSLAETNDPTDIEAFEHAREQAWPKIKKLLGIK